MAGSGGGSRTGGWLGGSTWRYHGSSWGSPASPDADLSAGESCAFESSSGFLGGFVFLDGAEQVNALVCGWADGRARATAGKCRDARVTDLEKAWLDHTPNDVDTGRAAMIEAAYNLARWMEGLLEARVLHASSSLTKFRALFGRWVQVANLLTQFRELQSKMVDRRLGISCPKPGHLLNFTMVLARSPKEARPRGSYARGNPKIAT